MARAWVGHPREEMRMVIEDNGGGPWPITFGHGLGRDARRKTEKSLDGGGRWCLEEALGLGKTGGAEKG